MIGALLYLRDHDAPAKLVFGIESGDALSAWVRMPDGEWREVGWCIGPCEESLLAFAVQQVGAVGYSRLGYGLRFGPDYDADGRVVEPEVIESGDALW